MYIVAKWVRPLKVRESKGAFKSIFCFIYCSKDFDVELPSIGTQFHFLDVSKLLSMHWSDNVAWTLAIVCNVGT